MLVQLITRSGTTEVGWSHTILPTPIPLFVLHRFLIALSILLILLFVQRALSSKCKRFVMILVFVFGENVAQRGQFWRSRWDFCCLSRENIFVNSMLIRADGGCIIEQIICCRENYF